MTLHWWMHWFWITTIFGAVCITTAESLPSPDASVRSVTVSSSVSPVLTGISFGPEHHSLRKPKSIGAPKEPLRFPYPAASDIKDIDPIPSTVDSSFITDAKHKQLDIPPSEIPKPDAVNLSATSSPQETEDAILRYQLANNKTLLTESVIKLNDSVEDIPPGNHTGDDLEEEASNRTNGTNIVKEYLTTVSSDLVEEFSTDGTVSKASLATILSSGENREPSSETMLGHASQGSDRSMDPAAIAGISLGVLAIATLAATISFVFYRRRYLNKPQTLSDKCSNPDSSGYIDDSTIRENSEEMYSLDNDSFLNSLEAMTIQNYWTDSVKHTKL